MVAVQPHSQESHTPHLAFVMEQQVGMKTVSENWQQGVAQLAQIKATWVPVTYYEEQGWIERAKFLPNSIRGVPRGYQQVKKGLTQPKYDVLMFNTYNPAVFHQQRVRNNKTFLMFDVTPRQYDEISEWYGHKADKDGLLKKWKHQQVLKTFQSATGIFPWSNWAAKSAIEDYGVAPEKVFVLPPGVDTNLWHPIPEFQKPNDGVTRILFTGGDFERKGGDLLLRWAKETRSRNWELHLVTRKPVEALPNVIIHNNMGNNSSALIELAQKCDIFALPTRADCFSLASIEAMATGLPVITTKVGGIPDIVKDRETGYLLEPDDYRGLCQALDRLIACPELSVEMGRAGRRVACESFDTTTNVKRGLERMLDRELI